MSEIINVQHLSLNPLADAMQRCEYQVSRKRASWASASQSIIIPFAAYHTEHRSTIFLCEELPDMLPLRDFWGLMHHPH